MKTQKLNLEVGAISETGYVRQENQDRMSWSSVPWGQLYIVADGMGGHAGGAKAAELTTQGLEQHLLKASKDVNIEDAIYMAFEKTNKNVYDKAHVGDPKTEGMGSTAVMLLISDRIAKIAHVGDSRAYLYRKGKLHLLTKDHTQVQRMVDAGMLTPEQARNHPSASVLDRAIGNRPTVKVDIEPDLMLNDGDEILLCSDGLCGYAEDWEIESAIDKSLTLQENTNRLFNLALQKGGEDNITIQFIRYMKKTDPNIKESKGAFKPILMMFLFVSSAGGASYLAYDLANKTGEKKISQIKTEIAARDSKITQQQQQIESLNDKTSLLNSGLTERNSDIAKIEKIKEKSFNQVKQLKKKLNIKKKEILHLNGKLELTEQEKNSANKQIQSKEKIINKLLNKITRLEQDIVTLKTKLQLFQIPPIKKPAPPLYNIDQSPINK